MNRQDNLMNAMPEAPEPPGTGAHPWYVVSLLAFTAFYSLMALPLGYLADRLSRRSLIGIGVLLWSIATAACDLTRSFAQLFLARMRAWGSAKPRWPRRRIRSCPIISRGGSCPALLRSSRWGNISAAAAPMRSAA
jgi:MFS family permease